MKLTLKILLVLVVLLALIVTAVALFISPVAKNYIEKHDQELLGRSIRMQELKINIFTGRLRIADLRIGGAEDSTTFLRLDSFDMRLKLLPLLAHRVEVPYITFTQPDVKIYQRGTEFNFSGILDHFAGDTSTVAEAPSKPWAVGIYNIAIRRGHIFYKDLLLDATWGLQDMNLEIPGVYFSGAKTDVGAVLNFAEGGSLATKVAYDMEKSAFEVSLNLKDLALANTLPYFRQSLNITAVEGHLSAEVNLRGDVEHLLSLAADGTASLSRFAMHDNRGQVAVGIDSLSLRLTEGDLGQMKFGFEHLHIAGFSTYFEMTARGNNFLDLMKPAVPSATVTAAEVAAPAPLPTLHIADLQVTRSTVRFSDRTHAKPFVYQISDLRLTSRNFNPAGRNDITIDARMQKTGSAKLRWIGSVDDINNQDITIALTNLNLKDFTPYCEHYTAYPITSGNLTFRSQNTIRNRYLDGTNHLDVFEPKVDKKRKELTPEFKIPLKLGLYILKDKKGHVKMDLPVKGSLDSPEFSYRKIVMKAIGNVLLKVVTAPFSFLMGHNDNLEYIDIDPQQYAFSSEQYASFDKIASMLREKPELQIILSQRLNLERALPLQAATALRLAYAEHLRKADSLGRMGTTAAPIAPAASVAPPVSVPAPVTGTATAGTPDSGAATTAAVAGTMTMLEYDKIQQIDIRTPQVVAFADSLLRQRGLPIHGSPSEKALALFRDEATAQITHLAARRDQALTQYMLTSHELKAPALRIEQPDSTAAPYTGHHRYTLAVELEGERVSPADSTATQPAIPAEKAEGTEGTANAASNSGTASSSEIPTITPATTTPAAPASPTVPAPTDPATAPAPTDPATATPTTPAPASAKTPSDNRSGQA